MKFTLKDYQSEAVGEVLSRLRKARKDGVGVTPGIRRASPGYTFMQSTWLRLIVVSGRLRQPTRYHGRFYLVAAAERYARDP